MSEAVKKIMAARVLAQSRWPYISHLLFSLRLVPSRDSSLSTIGVDAGWRLYFNEDFVSKQPVTELATILQHEAMHCMLNHHARFTALKDPDPDHNLYNIAGDCGINHVIEESGFKFSRETPVVRYSNFDELDPAMTTERAYFVLKQQRQQGGSGDGAAEDTEDDGVGDHSQDCGSIAGGSARSYESKADDGEAPAASQELQSAVRYQVATEIARSAQGAGIVPGGLIRWAEDFIHPKVNWRRQLAVRVRHALATKAGRRDYSMMRPSRREQGLRSADTQIRLPAMRQPQDPKTTVVVDTSGSVSDDELKATLAELIGITRAVGNASGVEVIACDTEAYPPIRVKSASDIRQLKLQGGGGTDMRVGMTAALASRPRPDVVVVVTDGATPWPDVKPNGCDNFIVLLTHAAEARRVPSWAKTVQLDLDED